MFLLEAFKLKNSYTYLQIKADVEVEPLLMKMPLFDQVIQSDSMGTKWYELKYDGVYGY